jgi:hypothetical protein
LYGVAAPFANALILAGLIDIFDGQRDSALGSNAVGFATMRAPFPMS